MTVSRTLTHTHTHTHTRTHSTFAVEFKSLLDRRNGTKHRLAINPTLDVWRRTKLVGKHSRYPRDLISRWNDEWYHASAITAQHTFTEMTHDDQIITPIRWKTRIVCTLLIHKAHTTFSWLYILSFPDIVNGINSAAFIGRWKAKRLSALGGLTPWPGALTLDPAGGSARKLPL